MGSPVNRESAAISSIIDPAHALQVSRVNSSLLLLIPYLKWTYKKLTNYIFLTNSSITYLNLKSAA